MMRLAESRESSEETDDSLRDAVETSEYVSKLLLVGFIKLKKKTC
jgi:hypothetical protein